MDFKRIVVKEGVEVISVPASRFKTNEISLSFAVPLRKDTASVNALLIKILSHSSAEFKNMRELNKKLALLYGANLVSSAVKQGEAQLLTLNITSLSDRFALDDERISDESIKLLLSLVFGPRLDENGLFYDEDIEREKRLLVERIESENNEKRIYALRRLEEEMFRDEPYGINALGTAESVKSVTKGNLKEALNTLIKTAKIQLTAVGNINEESVASLVKDSIKNTERAYTPIEKSVFVPKAKEVKTVEERQKIKQGKLVLGYRVNMESDDEGTADMRAFCDVFGGGPYSKLFNNVREKFSLCYYCSARYIRRKSCIIIQCGCEEENMDKAVEEIQNQLNDIIYGDYKEEFEASKIGLSDSINSVVDDGASLLAWYVYQAGDKDIVSTAQSAKENDEVKYERISECAKLLSLDTIYKLMSEKEEQ